MDAVPHVVIVGGGFGGLYAARALKRAPVRITLVDRRNHHLFQPLLYQVATAALSPGDIACPIRSTLRRQRNARVILGDARSIDTGHRRVVLDHGELTYNYLVLATGATHSYFGHDEWAPLAPGLKTVEDALEIRRRVLFAYEAAEREPDARLRREWLTFVVVGAGPTGVELAGALAEIGRRSLARDFRSIDPTQVRVLLIEGMDRVLPGYPDTLSASAERQLTNLGVDVTTSTMVTGMNRRGVELGRDRVGARTVLWAAGVQSSPLATTLGVPLDRTGRVKVEPDLSAPGRPEVFVIGDLATLSVDGVPVPGVAPAAIQEGRHAARNIVRALEGRATRAFRYRNKGSLATIGRSKAVADLPGGLRFSGFFAWLAWWAVHIFFLIGFRNRILVMFGWAWNWITFQRGARLITGDVPGDPPAPGDSPRTAAGPHPGP